jgi:hypothetical protein
MMHVVHVMPVFIDSGQVSYHSFVCVEFVSFMLD